ncbi:hypothetical protein LSH36_153g00063 [Paralvinella palmiformis]|uniref:Fibrinogen C-terminal domain-containing protein n=1 Tax=Paralvinella palmiformis TaxID=53620 RepID=A0AAD9JU35_9ANNE|nr:hypothetical protein LSH36_153g00063 [Paralvinella palmiformis]
MMYFTLITLDVMMTLMMQVTCLLNVRFNPNQMKPEDGLLSTETCTRFVPDQDMRKEQYSTFRIDIPEDSLDFVNITVQGENISCGYDLYVMSLTVAETTHWSGIWMACPLLEMTAAAGRNKRCIFRCQCNGVCKQIQAYRKPHNYESAWTLCSICIQYKIKDELAVSFNPKQIIPENNTLSKDTCTRFVADNNSSKEQFSTFRIELAEDNVFFVNVSLQGLNMSGGNDLYVTPLTESQTRNWSGMWMTCHLARKSDGDGIKRYTFSCPCYGICKLLEDLIILKRVLGICVMYVSHIIQQVIMRRMDGSVDFNRGWEDYKYGFGQITGEYLAGNENLYKSTSGKRIYSLRVDLVSYDGDECYALYKYFRIGPELDGYRLHVEGYEHYSTLGNSLTFHNNQKFSTKWHNSYTKKINVLSHLKLVGGSTIVKMCYLLRLMDHILTLRIIMESFGGIHGEKRNLLRLLE